MMTSKRATVFLSAIAASWLPGGGAAGQAGHEHRAQPDPGEAQSGLLDVLDRADERTLVIELGPIDLPANTDHHALEQIPVQFGEIPFDFTIRSLFADIVDEEGELVPREVLHHANLLDPTRRELFLPIMLRIMAASHETPRVSVPGWLFGIPMRGGSPFLALAMLHNPTDRDYRGVRVRLQLGYERRELLPMYSIVPFHLDTMFPQAERKAFDLPPGRSSKSYESKPAVDGMIVGLSGHLHRYATRLRLEDVTTGEVLYDVRPATDDDGHIEEIPVLLHRGKGLGARVHASHVYRVTAEYLNPTAETIVDGGMGAVAGAFIPLDEWPRADTTHPLYVADRQWVIASQLEHGDAHGH
ncbi:MAG: hypothetical protein R3195_16825 [Gemmatimonadota bacterium]|nr:hypothetical protein [Gemmatimonadota bacterium]